MLFLQLDGLNKISTIAFAPYSIKILGINMIKVSVIIPYYQRDKGILRRALNSVLSQSLPQDVQIDVIVVDDESPAPVQPEIEGLAFNNQFNMVLLKQKNGGVAAARNAGLKYINKETTYIAFLDSDDIWQPQHLENAIYALNLGVDYYFCDSQRVASQKSTFEESGFDSFLLSGNKRGAKISIADKSWYICKNTFFDFSIKHWVSLIPTVVYRRSVAPDITFDTSLKIAGEDCLFLFQVIEKCTGIYCSSQKFVTIADGVNIHAATYSWDDPGHITRYMCQILAFNEYRKRLRLSAENDRIIAGQIINIKRLFAFHTVRYFAKNRQAWPQELVKMTRTDSKFWVWYPFYIAYVAICYPLGLYDPLKEWW